MPPAKKNPNKGGGANKKLNAEQEALARANAIDDNYDEENKKTMRYECRTLKRLIEKEEVATGQYNDERLRINYFWLVAKKELEDKQAELRNKNREHQDLQEKNSITIKIWRQRLKHLMFQNLDQQTMVKKQAQIKLKNSEDEHRINERELKQDLRALKVMEKEQDVRQTEYSNALTKHYNALSTQKRKEHERIASEIQEKYKAKMTRLREDMETRRKAEIAKIEAKKNRTIEELKQKHEQKYQEIRDYYNDITRLNMDMISTLRTDFKTEKARENQANREKMIQHANNDMIVKPLEHVKKEIAKLLDLQIKNNKVRDDLADEQKKIVKTQQEYQEVEWQYEVRLQQYQYIEQEKKQLFEKFHNIVYDVHRKTGLRNLILEKKLETIQEGLETKDA